MKSKILFIFVLLVSLLLFSCKSLKVSYIDSSNNRQTREITKTSDKEEVIEEVYSILKSEISVKPISDLTFDINMNNTYSNYDGTSKAILNENIKIMITIDKDKYFSDLDGFIKNTYLHLIRTITGVIINDGVEEKIETSTIECYLDNGYLYYIFNLDDRVATQVMRDNKNKLVKIKYDRLSNSQLTYNNYILNSYIYSILFKNLTVDKIEKIIQGTRINKLHTEDEFDTLKAKLDVFVSNHSLSVKDTKKTKVTFGIEDEKDIYIDNRLLYKKEGTIDFTIDLLDLSINNGSFTFYDMNSYGVFIKGEGGFTCTYQSNITKLTDEEKNSAINLNSGK